MADDVMAYSKSANDSVKECVGTLCSTPDTARKSVCLYGKTRRTINEAARSLSNIR